MKINKYVLVLAVVLMILSACSKESNESGKSSLDGDVKVMISDPSPSKIKDTFEQNFHFSFGEERYSEIYEKVSHAMKRYIQGEINKETFSQELSNARESGSYRMGSNTRIESSTKTANLTTIYNRLIERELDYEPEIRLVEFAYDTETKEISYIAFFGDIEGKEMKDAVVTEEDQRDPKDATDMKEETENTAVAFLNPMKWSKPYAGGEYDPHLTRYQNKEGLPDGIIDETKEEILSITKNVQKSVTSNEAMETTLTYFNTYEVRTKSPEEKLEFLQHEYKTEKIYNVYVLGKAKEKEGEWIQQSENVFQIIQEADGPVFYDYATTKLSATDDAVFEGIPEDYALRKVEFHRGTLYLQFEYNTPVYTYVTQNIERRDAYIKQVYINDDNELITNRIVYQGSISQSPPHFARSTQGSAIYYGNNETGNTVITVYPTTGDKLSFTDKHDLLLKRNTKLHFLDLNDMKAYFEYIDLKQLDLTTGEPLYDRNGQDKVIDVHMGASFVHVFNGVLYVYDYEGLSAYDTQLNYIEAYHPAMYKKVPLTLGLLEAEEGKFDYISTSDTSINFWNFTEYQRKPDLERVEIRFIGTPHPALIHNK